MAEFTVRAARMEDIAGVVALDRATELLPHWAEAEYAAAVAGSLEGSVRRCLFVAETTNELVGFAVGMVAVAGDSILSSELESVAVSRDHRRVGVAKALCSEVTAWVKRTEATELELEVRSQSTGAIRLYEGLGFVEVGRRVRYYQVPSDDAVLMRLMF